MPQYSNLQEEELKIRIAEQFFAAFDCGARIGKIDFCVIQRSFRKKRSKNESNPIVSLLWAEAKRGTVADIYKPLVQLILTIGRARTFDTYLPPPFLAAFDAEKIAFLPYREILPFLALNDFNWSVTPSDTSSREFELLYAAVRDVLDRTAYVFRYDAHEKELRAFIKQELKVSNKPLPLIKNHRERKGSFFTPKIWVDLSQKYLADVLGENWQDEYYVWDCAAGTGNLLNGLTNKYNIWASTLDQQDVDVMKDRIKNGANLLESHVFQFDFLNDEFTKLPQQLQDIINDPEKRKKLVVYINPPYAEVGVAKGGKGKEGIQLTNTHTRYKTELQFAGRELFTQFLVRIYNEIPSCRIAQFSKLKVVQAPNFSTFRIHFRAQLEKVFLMPADTFDNVDGQFPIGFFIWNGAKEELFKEILADVYDRNGGTLSTKFLFPSDRYSTINDWLKTFSEDNENAARIGILNTTANDFQNQNRVRISSIIPKGANMHKHITSSNFLQTCVYFSVRHSVALTWLNDRDQFFYPNARWRTDNVFHNNCLVFTLFHGQNRIIFYNRVNHWIPFTEAEVVAKEKFESHFMTDFMAGKLFHPLTHQSKTTLQALAEEKSFIPSEPLIFSPEAIAVFDAGRELWRYYHAQPDANPNASYYDIREHFQGRNEKGKMNPKSDDETYNLLLSNLKEAMETLRLKIVPKVYEYGFLIE